MIKFLFFSAFLSYTIVLQAQLTEAERKVGLDKIFDSKNYKKDISGDEYLFLSAEILNLKSGKMTQPELEEQKFIIKIGAKDSQCSKSKNPDDCEEYGYLRAKYECKYNRKAPNAPDLGIERRLKNVYFDGEAYQLNKDSNGKYIWSQIGYGPTKSPAAKPPKTNQ